MVMLDEDDVDLTNRWLEASLLGRSILAMDGGIESLDALFRTMHVS